MFISSDLKLELFRWINWTCWQTEILTELLVFPDQSSGSPPALIPNQSGTCGQQTNLSTPSSPSARPPASVWALSLRLNCQSPAAVVPPQAAKPISVSDSRLQSFSSTFQTLFFFPRENKTISSINPSQQVRRGDAAGHPDAVVIRVSPHCPSQIPLGCFEWRTWFIFTLAFPDLIFTQKKSHRGCNNQQNYQLGLCELNWDETRHKMTLVKLLISLSTIRPFYLRMKSVLLFSDEPFSSAAFRKHKVPRLIPFGTRQEESVWLFWRQHE